MNNHEDLTQFLIEANQAGYASGDQMNEQKQPDNSTTIEYQSGVWKMHDNWFGGEPYGGREVIFLNGKPHWLMGYYGWVNPEIDREQVYSFLRAALKKMPKTAPFRGPESFGHIDWKYTNNWSGSVDSFTGIEVIFYKGKEVYRAHYHGGLIDQ